MNLFRSGFILTEERLLPNSPDQFLIFMKQLFFFNNQTLFTMSCLIARLFPPFFSSAEKVSIIFYNQCFRYHLIHF